ncbi:MAG: preprotein translocase subunit SecA, partial [Clostridia bacterium]|nr:preprotein translocase subunit SecA [Clostridia bacterium]
MGLISFLSSIDNKRSLKRLNKEAEEIIALKPSFEKLSDEELANKTQEFKDRLKNGEKAESLRKEAYAVVREASRRVLNMEHYKVQIMGGIALFDGRITEMKTGEGKTLVETLPAYLAALSGKGVHIVTVNDYLARRDAEWMGKIFKFLKLTVGVISPLMPDDERKKAYNCDITYGTNNEFGFDYLRDNLKVSLDGKVQRELNFAIVDEVDSILIDEARTP